MSWRNHVIAPKIAGSGLVGGFGTSGETVASTPVPPVAGPTYSLSESSTGLLFWDDFEREAGATIGNGWVETPSAPLSIVDATSTFIMQASNGTFAGASRSLQEHTDTDNFVIQCNAFPGVGGGWLGVIFFRMDNLQGGGEGDVETGYGIYDQGPGTNLHRWPDGSVVIALGNHTDDQWHTFRIIVTGSEGSLGMQALTAVDVGLADITTDLTHRGYYIDEDPLTNSNIALNCNEQFDGWDDIMAYSASAITITNVPTSYSIKLDARDAIAETGSSVTIPVTDWASWYMPHYTMSLISASVTIDTWQSASGIWGGSVFNVNTT